MLLASVFGHVRFLGYHEKTGPAAAERHFVVDEWLIDADGLLEGSFDGSKRAVAPWSA